MKSAVERLLEDDRQPWSHENTVNAIVGSFVGFDLDASVARLRVLLAKVPDPLLRQVYDAMHAGEEDTLARGPYRFTDK
jgi:hypothetical protein